MNNKETNAERPKVPRSFFTRILSGTRTHVLHKAKEPMRYLKSITLILCLVFLFAISVEAAQCQAITKKGTQCKRQAKAESRYCWQHQKGAVSKKKQARPPLYQRKELPAPPTLKADPETIEVLTQYFREKGYRKHEIPEILEMGGFMGKPSVSLNTWKECQEVLRLYYDKENHLKENKRPPPALLEKKDSLSEERRKQLETAAKFGINEEELDNLTAFLEEFTQLEAHEQEKLTQLLFKKDYPYGLLPTLIDKDGDGKNSINDWGQMNLKEKRQQAIYNLIRANKAATRESVDTMIRNLNYMTALHYEYAD